jgi:hypothetical protein
LGIQRLTTASQILENDKRDLVKQLESFRILVIDHSKKIEDLCEDNRLLELRFLHLEKKYNDLDSEHREIKQYIGARQLVWLSQDSRQALGRNEVSLVILQRFLTTRLDW